MRLFFIPLVCFLYFAPLSAQDVDPHVEADLIGRERASADLTVSEPEIRSKDLELYLNRLASVEFGGRLPGQPGERMATTYFASFIEALGLVPAGNDGTYFQEFSFGRGKIISKRASENNYLKFIDEQGGVRGFKPGNDYQPIAISASSVVNAPIVFAGFGIDAKDYNNYRDLDVKGKWVLVLRGRPEDRPELQGQYAPLFRKAQVAKQKGAVGILYVKAGNPNVGSEIIHPDRRIGPGQAILPSITISDKVAASLFSGSKMSDLSLKQIFDQFNSGEVSGFSLAYSAHAKVELASNRIPYRNVLGRLVVGDKPSEEAVYVGAHIDHLGYGQLGGTLARGAEASKFHPGADDNASGTVALLELAHYFAKQKQQGQLKLKRDLVFVAFSAEELGVFGSRQFIVAERKRFGKEIYPRIAAFINLDMIGRASSNNANSVSLYGTDSSYDWREIIEQVEPVEGLNIKQVADPNKPADSQSFYLGGVPALFAHTEAHPDYHTPEDIVDKIDFEGLTRITRYLSSLIGNIAARPAAPSYAFVPRETSSFALIRSKLGIRVRLNEIGDDSEVAVAEVLSSSSEKSSLQKGDFIKMLNQQKVTSIQSLLYSLNLLTYGKTYPMTIVRNGQSKEIILVLPKRKIPFDHFNVSVETGTGILSKTSKLSVSASIKQSGDRAKLQTLMKVNCLDFPATQRDFSTAEQELFIEAGRYATGKNVYEKSIKSRKYWGTQLTTFESVNSGNNVWNIKVTRGEKSVLFDSSEGDNLKVALGEAQIGIRWFETLAGEQLEASGEEVRPPKSLGYHLDSTIGRVMTNNEKLGIEISVGHHEMDQYKFGYSLLNGTNGATGGEWVADVIKEIGKALEAAAKQVAYVAKVKNCTITADIENQIVVIEATNRSSKLSGSFNQADYRQIQGLLNRGEEMKTWFAANEHLFFTKSE